MKGSMKRLLTVCLFAGMLGSYSVGSAYGIESRNYVPSRDNYEDETDRAIQREFNIESRNYVVSRDNYEDETDRAIQREFLAYFGVMIVCSMILAWLFIYLNS